MVVDLLTVLSNELVANPFNVTRLNARCSKGGSAGWGYKHHR
jgi:hypothetical protein